MKNRVLIPLTAVALSLAALGASPDAALAQDETIDACVHSGSGVLYLPGDRGEAGEECASRDDALSWNEQGPPGPPGPPGVARIFYKLRSRFDDRVGVSSGRSRELSLLVQCPSGSTLIGGGGRAFSPHGDEVVPGVVLVSSSPSLSPAGWLVEFRIDNRDGTGSATIQPRAFAVCADLSK